MSERVSVKRFHADTVSIEANGAFVSIVDYDALSRDLAAARAELHQYRLSPQLGCSVEAEVWHQLRMKMDAALGPDFDPYVRGECFAALDAIIGQRDEALGLLRGYASDNRTHIEWCNDVAALLRKVRM